MLNFWTTDAQLKIQAEELSAQLHILQLSP